MNWILMGLVVIAIIGIRLVQDELKRTEGKIMAKLSELTTALSGIKTTVDAIDAKILNPTPVDPDLTPEQQAALDALKSSADKTATDAGVTPAV